MGGKSELLFLTTKTTKEELRTRWPDLEGFTDYWFPREVQNNSLFPFFLQEILVALDSAGAEIPLVQRHVTTSWPVVSFKEGESLLLPPFALGERHFNIRAELTNRMLLSQLYWLGFAVWGSRSIDSQLFEEAADLMYSSEKAEKIEANLTELRRMLLDQRLEKKRAEEILEGVGIRKDSNWGKILLQEEERATLDNIVANFPPDLKELEGAFLELPLTERKLISSAFPVVVEYRTEWPALIILSPEFNRNYNYLVGELERDPRLILPSTRGVEKAQVVRFLCRESTIEKLEQLCSQKGFAVPIDSIEKERVADPEIFIDTCIRRYGDWTMSDYIKGIEDGRFLPLVSSDLGKGVYGLDEFGRFKFDWDKRTVKE